MDKKAHKAKPYTMPLILICAIFFGGVAGFVLGPNATSTYLQPLGDIFIHLLFTAIVPMIFFSISTAIVRACTLGTLGTIMTYMSIVFLATGFIAAVFGLSVVLCFPPAEGVHLVLNNIKPDTSIHIGTQITNMLTVGNFAQLLSHEHILALIIFSILVGLAAAKTKEKASSFISFLAAGESVFMRVFDLIMYYAPIGFFAYFAVLVSELGPQLLGHYARVTLLYYVFAFAYFLVAYTIFAYCADKKNGIRRFWSSISIPMLTALATCSSAASIPANLAASKKMAIPQEIAETTIPLGSLIHKDGSVIGGAFKIAFLFGLFQLDFSGTTVLLTAVGISILVGTVMGAIPSGGMLGELLILSAYGLPPSSLIAIAAISILIDPLATMLNVTGNTVSSMLIARLVYRKSPQLQ